MSQPARNAFRAAFTLVELLVVIAIISLLVSMMTPMLSRIKETTQTTTCTNNLGNLATAWQLFVTGNNMKLPSPNRWKDTKAWAMAPNRTGGNGTSETLDEIKLGTLWPYTNTTKIYLCPADPLPRYITYSISDTMGEGYSGVPAVKKLVSTSEPSQTMVFIEENDLRPPSWTGFSTCWNMGAWCIGVDVDEWDDPVPSWHSVGACLSFADGHAEYWKWTDPRMTDVIEYIRVNGGQMDGCQDLRRVQSVYKPLR